MQLRPTQNATFRQIDSGLLSNLSRLVKAQAQVATGKRIGKPSDDPVGASRALGYARHIAGTERYGAASRSGSDRLAFSASRLEEAGGELADARALLVQGLNGTLNEGDRKSLAAQVRILRERLLEAANSRDADGYLFGGTETAGEPFVSSKVGGRERARYVGNGDTPELLVGQGLRVETGYAGDSIFAAVQRSGTQYSGSTGIGAGQSGDAGTGFLNLELRHDGTSGAPGSGLALVAGAADTLLGAHSLTVDAAAGTLRLDGGTAVAIPAGGTVALEGALGAVLHVDVSGYDGTSSSSTISGAGSISFDGLAWTALDFVSTDTQLVDPATGGTIHVDQSGIRRAGSELVLFGGAVNAFDTLQGIADDLDNQDGVSSAEVQERLGMWLTELDRNSENVIQALGVTGGRGARLANITDRLEGERTEFLGQRSTLVDTDYSEAVLEMTRAEQSLQLAQATATRLFSNTLLNFLR
jgi:flagellar hook-associated protein 3 FlgL